MTGVLVLDKPEGFTSFDAVAVLRRLTGERKIGHTGTLDPMATGVLPMLLGQATRALPFLGQRPKTYEASFAFGLSTDTQDRTGTVQARDGTPISQEKLAAALPRFTGKILQTPPMYSALRKNGVRLYDLARQGKTVQREPRAITIYQLRLLSYDAAARTGELTLTCSGGTYVRTLCADLGEALGSHGVMTALRRTEASGFSLQDALPLAEAKQMDRAALLQRVLPAETLFLDLPQVTVTQPQAGRFVNGGGLALQRVHLPAGLAGRCRVKDPQGRFLGLGAPDKEKDELRVVRLFVREDGTKHENQQGIDTQ
ncbi:MAG: tRNA pseudouridine(55) synthase TruB [Oscillospiraceae bacterium]|nr:tRNA pseudouridine(55) synthase TruB [Oscillospiraceae bacterium]